MSFEVEVLPKQPTKLYSNVKCDGCNCELKEVHSFRDDKKWECLQPDDALEINLSGGYGMAIDPIDCSEDDLKFLFCRECTIKLCEQWPTIKKFIINNCSSTIGHHCSKEKKFVWAKYTNCCSIYCSTCGRAVMSTKGFEVEDDRYSRQIVDCWSGCKIIAPGVWGWEISCFKWVVMVWDDATTLNLIVTEPLSSKDNALKAKKLYKKDHPDIDDDYISIQKIAIYKI